jgi:hypothetical protein
MRVSTAIKVVVIVFLGGKKMSVLISISHRDDASPWEGANPL